MEMMIHNLYKMSITLALLAGEGTEAQGARGSLTYMLRFRTSLTSHNAILSLHGRSY